MIWTILLYFVIGLVYDVAITLYYLAVTDRRSAMAGLWSFLITVVQILILYEIIPSKDFLAQLIAYALGCGIGTYLTVKYNKQSKRLYADVLALLGLQNVRKGSRLQTTRKTEGRGKADIQRINRSWPRMEKSSGGQDVAGVRKGPPSIRA